MIFLLLILFYIDKTNKKNPKKECCPDASTLYDFSYFNQSNFPIPFRNYTFQDKGKYAGKGHFSIVKEQFLSDGTHVAIKELKIFKKYSLINELSILKALENVNHVVKLVGITGNESNPVIIYKYHSFSKESYQNMTMDQFKWWLRTLLETVKDIHSHGIIHRDLKINNILVDFVKKELTVIDFGLAEFNVYNGKKNPRTGCYRIKAPELIIEMHDYDCSSDIWSIGLSCLDIMIGLRSNWFASENKMQAENLISYFGSKKWNSFVSKYNPEYKTKSKMIGDIFELAMPGHYQLVTPESLDLVLKFLEFDPKERITAKQALKHPFFYN